MARFWMETVFVPPTDSSMGLLSATMGSGAVASSEHAVRNHRADRVNSMFFVS